MALLHAPDEATAQEQLQDAGHTDGLPVIVPTPERVERMVLALGLDGDAVLGVVPPADGVATVEKVAVNAVMAGCLPDHGPVVLAAVRAVLRPEFDLRELQATTHSLAPLVIVHGPARLACGPVASGTGALGPGHRANAVIGRALRLVLMNLGGGLPGIGDMSLLGNPAKFTYCFGENEEESPFPPLHTTRGLDAGASAVTVVGCESPHSVVSVVDEDVRASSERLLSTLAAVVANVGSNTSLSRGGVVPGMRGAVVVALNPDHAAALAAAGHDRASIVAAVVARAGNRRAELRALHPAAVADGSADDVIAALEGPDQVLLLVAGGGGAYSAVMPFWGGGAHANQPVTVEVVLDQACELPGGERAPG